MVEPAPTGSAAQFHQHFNLAKRRRGHSFVLRAPATMKVPGAALYPDDAADREALFKAADARLYQVKEAGTA